MWGQPIIIRELEGEKDNNWIGVNVAVKETELSMGLRMVLCTQASAEAVGLVHRQPAVSFPGAVSQASSQSISQVLLTI